MLQEVAVELVLKGVKWTATYRDRIISFPEYNFDKGFLVQSDMTFYI